jgi:hypothetical protein
MELRDDQNAMAGLMRVFQRLIDTAEEFQAMKIEFNLYFHTMSPYCREHVSSSCEWSWSSYSFVHSKARNRLLSSRAEDLVYVYTNSRVLNQNVPFTDEAATEWYKQTIVSEDSDSEGPADLFDDYDDVSDFDIPHMPMNDENIQGKSEEQDGLQQQA